ncbi:MAG: hypothetical protein KUG76_08330 [Gammaproteobacteria bacterium]|nr:hypothetical protein [Gammaproteobacteria bacterium]
MLTYIVFFAIVLACFPKGRKFLGFIMRLAFTAIGSYTGSISDGPYYDQNTGEVHYPKQPSGNYSSTDQFEE